MMSELSISPVVADEVQFESVAPSHRPLPVSGKTGENLVGIPAQVVAYGYHGGVHEGDASAPPEGVEVQEEHHLEEHPALQFHETVVGHRIREVTPEVDTDKVQVVVLEIVECAEMEHNQNRHNLAVGHTGSTPAASLPVGGQKRHIFNLLIKFLTKFIRSTENFCNFVVGNHELILLFYFISDWNSNIKVQIISQITNFL